MKTKEVFTVNVEGKDVELAVIKPSAQVMQEANIEYGRTFNKLLRAGVIIQQELEQEMRKRGIWDDTKQQDYERLRKDILAAEYKLDKGGIKLSEGREIALKMRDYRIQWQRLMAERVVMETNTAESQADNARFNFQVQRCLVYNDSGDLYFKTLDDYYSHINEEMGLMAAIKFSSLINKHDENLEAGLPENKFLREWGFIDDKLRLVDKQGKLVDEKGNLIDEDGFIVDENGVRLDVNGNPIDKDGNYAVEKQPFLDEDGNPIVKTNGGGGEDQNTIPNPPA